MTLPEMYRQLTVFLLTPAVQRRFSITREEPQTRYSLVARPGVVPYGTYKNLPLETRAKQNLPTGELNAKMRSNFFSRFWCFLVQWETFLDRIFEFNAPLEKKCSLARVSTGRFL